MKKKWIIIALLGVAVITWMSFKYKAMRTEKHFADYLLIREAGIYTLHGSKPITSMLIDYSKTPNVTSTYTAVKEPLDLQFSKSNYFEEKPADLWNHWKKRNPVSSSHYALVFMQKDTYADLYFVNKDAVRCALQKYYSMLVAQLGEEFNIEDTIQSIDNPHSYFWSNIFTNSIAMGIFFGYGINNAQKFDTHDSNSKFSNSLTDAVNVRFKADVSLDDLPLPMFKSFFDPDPNIEKYQIERKEIQKNYQNINLRKLLIQTFRR